MSGPRIAIDEQRFTALCTDLVEPEKVAFAYATFVRGTAVRHRRAGLHRRGRRRKSQQLALNWPTTSVPA